MGDRTNIADALSGTMQACPKCGELLRWYLRCTFCAVAEGAEDRGQTDG